MKQVGGVWMPDTERHFEQWMRERNEVVDGRLTYQYHKLREAMGWVKKFRVACDVGGHIGTWSSHLARKFQYVHAFEPVPLFRQCFEKNVPMKNVLLYACALGSVSGRMVRMVVDPADTGGTHIDATAESGDTVMRKLDEFDLQELDFLKVDCEGAEASVIEGARDTIRRCKPCCVIEQKQHKMAQNYGTSGTPAVDLLKGMGAKVRKEMSGDWILSWD